jgi:hypothetical protein
MEAQVTGSQLNLEEAPSATIWTLGQVSAAAEGWANTIQLSEPRSAVDEAPDLLVSTLFDRYVATRPPHRERARDRRWIKRKVTTALESARRLRHARNADPGCEGRERAVDQPVMLPVAN